MLCQSVLTEALGRFFGQLHQDHGLSCIIRPSALLFHCTIGALRQTTRLLREAAK